jgi:hypothetical protein
MASSDRIILNRTGSKTFAERHAAAKRHTNQNAKILSSSKTGTILSVPKQPSWPELHPWRSDHRGLFAPIPNPPAFHRLFPLREDTPVFAKRKRKSDSELVPNSGHAPFGASNSLTGPNESASRKTPILPNTQNKFFLTPRHSKWDISCEGISQIRHIASPHHRKSRYNTNFRVATIGSATGGRYNWRRG